jgi:hypothetical protein
MKIGIKMEGKVPVDERVPLSPKQCKELLEKYPNNQIELYIQSSSCRRFKDEEYSAEGLNVVDSIDDCDVILGVKEVKIDNLIPHKTYFYFSHTTKQQPYNRSLLCSMLAKNITMIDYENLRNKNGRRLIGFGRYAGIVGCYNTFYAFGKRTKKFELKRAYKCENANEMESELVKIVLPNSYKIALTGNGRVALGAIEIIEKIGIKRVTPEEFKSNKAFGQPVFTQLQCGDYNRRIDGEPFCKLDFYHDPSNYESTFMDYARQADMYIACHYWHANNPFVFTRNNVKESGFRIKVIGDISCDIDGPIGSTIRPSTIRDPLYGYDPNTESEVSYDNKNAITVMAVDNLPCELPNDASEDFGREFIEKVFPHLLNDSEGIIDKATICKEGTLTPYYEYLRDYVNGVEKEE